MTKVELACKVTLDPRMPDIKDASYMRLVPGEEKAGLLAAVNQPADCVFEAFDRNMFPSALRSMIE
jgi:hypothetical protein